jgi:hypothetical protein
MMLWEARASQPVVDTPSRVTVTRHRPAFRAGLILRERFLHSGSHPDDAEGRRSGPLHLRPVNGVSSIDATGIFRREKTDLTGKIRDLGNIYNMLHL